MIKCELCSGPLPVKNKRFCSTKCRSGSGKLNYKNGLQSPIGKCIRCGMPRTGRGVKYCTPECGYAAQIENKVSKWISGQDIYSSEYGAPDFIRNYLRKINNNKCQECGWNQIHPITKLVPLQIDHVDGDCTNNNIDNLRLLCPNCHSLTENYGVLNKGNSKRKYRYGK